MFGDNGGPAVVLYCMNKWFESATQPEFESFLPDLLNEGDITVSFEIMALIDLDYDTENGWRLRFQLVRFC